MITEMPEDNPAQQRHTLYLNMRLGGLMISFIRIPTGLPIALSRSPFSLAEKGTPKPVGPRSGYPITYMNIRITTNTVSSRDIP